MAHPKTLQISASHQHAIDNWLITHDAKQAAAAGGFCRQNTFYGILARPECAAYLEVRQTELAERFRLSQEDVIQKLMSIYERSMQAEPVFDRRGQPTGEYRFEAPGAVAAMREIAKILGYYAKDNAQSRESPIVLINKLALVMGVKEITE